MDIHSTNILERQLDTRRISNAIAARVVWRKLFQQRSTL
jgi:hypothetical protein